MARDLGDFQTPPELIRLILKRLEPIAPRWPRVLEPTCGSGNFIRALLASQNPPRQIVGIEIQESHLNTARQALKGLRANVRLIRGNIFTYDLQSIQWEAKGPLLIIGNPPWVTNSEIGALGGSNLPNKHNFLGLKGLDAITGAANFDIAEYIWLRLLSSYYNEDVTIALLSKTSVARKVLNHVYRMRAPMIEACLYRIDAKRWFKAAVDACLFIVHLRPGVEPTYECKVYRDLECDDLECVWGIVNGKLVRDAVVYRRYIWVDGKCPLEWRQGVKHDASSTMELTCVGEELRNGYGERVDVESEYVYPLVKGSEIKPPNEIRVPTRWVIVPQKRLSDDTSELSAAAPKLWRYLWSHKSDFERRRSSIFRQSGNEFSVFGVGPYSFAAYKVAISGLRKDGHFVLIPPYNGKPVMLDDTCYFVGMDSPYHAALIAALLNSEPVRSFLASVVFPDSKRPYTKRVLQTIDLTSVYRKSDHEVLLEKANRLLREMEKVCRINAEPIQNVDELRMHGELLLSGDRKVSLPQFF